MQNYYGTLVYNLKEQKDNFADIVIKRNNDELNIDWIVYLDEKYNVKISLNFDNNKKEINFLKCSNEIQNNNDVQKFLENIKNSINNLNGTFMPSSNLNKNSIKL